MSSEDSLLARLRSSQPSDRCWAAREAGERAELDRSYIDALRDLLDDDSTIVDPNDPPGYDWNGGPPVWPGSRLSIASEAGNALRKSGGSFLLDLLRAERSDPSRRLQALRHGLQIYGVSHPLIAESLAHEDRSIRETLAALIADSRGTRVEAFPVLAPALVDPSDAVVASIVAALLSTYRLPKRGDEARACAPTVEMAKTRLENASSDARPLRAKAFVIATMASESWDELATVCHDLDDVGFAAVIEIATHYYYTEPGAFVSLASHPTLRARTRSAAFARFRLCRERKRWNETRVLGVFGPDREAFGLVLEAVRAEAWAIDVAARFAEADKTLLPPLVLAICSGEDRSESGAIATRDLIERDPVAFAKILSDEPNQIEQRLATLTRLLRHLPSRSEGAGHIERIRALIAACARDRSDESG